MRFTHKPCPSIGDTRTRTAFLWFPKTLHTTEGVKETRWLEVTTWTDQYVTNYFKECWWRAGFWTDKKVNSKKKTND